MVQHRNADRTGNSGKGVHPQLRFADTATAITRAAIPQIVGDKGGFVWQIDTGQIWAADGAGGWDQVTGAAAGGGLADTTDDQDTQTTNATATTIATYTTLADQRTITMKILVWGREAATGDQAKYLIEAEFGRDGTSTVLELDTAFLVAREDQAAWDVTLVISSQDIQIKVTGEASKTIEWRCQLEVSEHG